MSAVGHCEAPLWRRSNLDGQRAPGSRLLRCARNDIWKFFAILLFVFCIAAPAYAVRPDEMMADPAQEARAREVGKELRCLVCRNQSIDDSEADLAHDLRVIVRERIGAGDSNDQVLSYVRARYGDFVLLRPPFQGDTLLLWGGPLIVLLVGGFAAWRFCRGRAALPATAPLSPDERRRLDAVLHQGSES